MSVLSQTIENGIDPIALKLIRINNIFKSSVNKNLMRACVNRFFQRHKGQPEKV